MISLKEWSLKENFQNSWFELRYDSGFGNKQPDIQVFQTKEEAIHAFQQSNHKLINRLSELTIVECHNITP